jgi:anhydro-N-acetylmuramic acid kinase
MALTTALGLMSGTSMDGIDLALLRSDGDSVVERGPGYAVAYDAPFRRKLEQGLQTAKAIVKREDRPGDLSTLEREITQRHADAVAAFLRDVPAGWRDVDLIGFHGQTVLHRPHEGVTVQLGDGALLRHLTGVPVVYDMRANDMKNGGQGAPLVPAYHAALAKSLSASFSVASPVTFVNIGGISNITYVPEFGDPIAFDSGPGNALIDQWVQREAGVPYDDGGRIASEGGVVREVVDRYLARPFFGRSGPKSLDRLDFSLDEVAGLELANGARTLAAVSAEAIMKSVDHLPRSPKLWIVCGGGRKNPNIINDMRMLAEHAGSQVVLAEDAGFDGDAMEAEAWAYLAVRAQQQLPLTFPTTTGSRIPVTGGIFAEF